MFNIFKTQARLRKLELENAKLRGGYAAHEALLQLIVNSFELEHGEEIINACKEVVGEGFGLESEKYDAECLNTFNNNMSRTMQHFIETHDERKKSETVA